MTRQWTEVTGNTRTSPQALIAAILILAVSGFPYSARAQASGDAPPKLNIDIIEGEDAINNIRLRTAREPIVEVTDENHKPIAGALVLFALPTSGPGGEFANGARTLSVVTDAQGRAVATGFRPNATTGHFEIRVNASYRGATAERRIRQRNAKPGLSTGAKAAIIAAIIAAAIAGIVIGLNHGGGSSSSTPPTVITPGPPTVGGK
jgi:hypothetical protein